MGKTFTEWIDKQPDYGLCPPPMTSEEFKDFITRYHVSEYTTKHFPVGISMSESQVRTEILCDILLIHSKKFRKEWKEYWKRKRVLI